MLVTQPSNIENTSVYKFPCDKVPQKSRVSIGLKAHALDVHPSQPRFGINMAADSIKRRSKLFQGPKTPSDHRRLIDETV